MDITRDFFEGIQKEVKYAQQYSDVELEAKYVKDIENTKFKELLKFYRKNKREYVESNSTTLDISVNSLNGSTRTTITGCDSVRTYCISNGKELPDDVSVMRKTRIDGHNAIHLNESNDSFDFKLNIKKEAPVHEAVNSAGEDLHYRLKRRCSFQSKSMPFRIDLTSVRTLNGEFSESALVNSVERRELEIEYIFSGSESKGKSEWRPHTEGFIKAMYTVMCVIHNTAYVIGDQTRSTVLKSYKKLLNIDPNRELDQSSYISYKPITLQLSNFDRKGAGIPGNVLENYAITEKADGERKLIYIHAGKLYFINDRFEVRYTGIRLTKENTSGECIIDGEYVKKTKLKGSSGLDSDIFLGFDIYYYNGEDIRSLHFDDGSKVSEGRYSKLKGVMKGIQSQSEGYEAAKILFRSKEYKFTKDGSIFENADKILNEESYNYEYRIDGLIYQPANLGSGFLYERSGESLLNRKNVEMSKNLSLTWSRVFKWKPPLENTIDFMIVFSVYPGATVTNCKLCVKDNISNRLSSVTDTLLGRSANVQRNTIFAEQEVSLMELNSYVIKSSDIVEFRFTESDDSSWRDQSGKLRSGRWMIHRKRQDKIDIFRMKNSDILNRNLNLYVDANLQQLDLGGSANAAKTANNVFTTISHEPVSIQVVTGQSDLEPSKMTSQYYVNSTQRRDLLLHEMLLFHNRVKEKLIHRFSGDLVDVACGVGGDIYKYNQKYRRVLGFDISYDGIYGSSQDSAWSRYSKMCRTWRDSRSSKNPIPMLFLSHDMGKSIHSVIERDTGDKSRDDLNELSRYILNREPYELKFEVGDPSTVEKVKKRLDPYRELLQATKFDVVSCQFALHYFFASDDTLEAFCVNVSSLLKVGGHFIGTCFDGRKLHLDLTSDSNGQLEGKVDGNVVWRICKGYEGDYEVEKDKCGFGVDVYIESIGQSRREYLVDMNHLAKKLKEHNIICEEVKSFESEFDDSMKKETVDIRRLSGMYQWFVFRKAMPK